MLKLSLYKSFLFFAMLYSASTYYVSVDETKFHLVKSYLCRYGYMNEDVCKQHADDSLKFMQNNARDIYRGLLIFQTMFNITRTGKIDEETIIQMAKPRCGNKDFDLQFNSLKFITQKSVDFTALRSNLKKLSYTIRKYNPYLNKYSRSLNDDEVEYTIDRAFQIWLSHLNDNVNIKRLNEQDEGFDKSNITIYFAEGYHGDSMLFDGIDGELSHSCPLSNTKSPFKGHVHLDDAENWDKDRRLLAVMLHQIGHLLGLDHSGNPRSIMSPVFNFDSHELLDEDIRNVKIVLGLEKSQSKIDRQETISTKSHSHLTTLLKELSEKPIVETVTTTTSKIEELTSKPISVTVEEATAAITKPILTEKDEVNSDQFELENVKPIEIVSSTEASKIESEATTQASNIETEATTEASKIETEATTPASITVPITTISKLVELNEIKNNVSAIENSTVSAEYLNSNEREDSITVDMVLSTTKLEKIVIDARNSTEIEMLVESTTVNPVLKTEESQVVTQNSDDEELLQILNQLNITLNETANESTEINKETTASLELNTEITTESSTSQTTIELTTSTTVSPAVQETTVNVTTESMRTEPISDSTEPTKTQELATEAKVTTSVELLLELNTTAESLSTKQAEVETTSNSTVYAVEDTTKVPNEKEEVSEEYNLCENSEIDEITRTEWGNAFIFKGNQVWHIRGLTKWRLFDYEGWPKKIEELFPGLPGHIDSAYYFDDHYFFTKNKLIWKYKIMISYPPKYTMVSGYPKSLKDEFPELPFETVDSAFAVASSVFFFKDHAFWQSDWTSNITGRVPFKVNAAVSWRNPRLEAGPSEPLAYIISNTSMYKFNYWSFPLSQEALDIRFFLFDCVQTNYQPSNSIFIGPSYKQAFLADDVYRKEANSLSLPSFLARLARDNKESNKTTSFVVEEEPKVDIKSLSNSIGKRLFLNSFIFLISLSFAFFL